MKKHIPFFILLVTALTIAGCSAPASTATERASAGVVDSTPSPTQAPMEEPTQATVAEPTQAPTQVEATQQPALSESQTRYQIVSGESKVSYEVGETFINQDNRFNLAVGVTTDISGEIVIDRQNPQNSTIGPITVDVSKFTSDSGRRDNVIRNDWLESRRFPLAVFTPSRIEGLPAEGVEGQTYALQITGDMKIKETVRQVTFTAMVSLTGDELIGTAETTLFMSQFGVGPISIVGILNTEDEVHLIFNFLARP